MKTLHDTGEPKEKHKITQHIHTQRPIQQRPMTQHLRSTRYTMDLKKLMQLDKYLETGVKAMK